MLLAIRNRRIAGAVLGIAIFISPGVSQRNPPGSGSGLPGGRTVPGQTSTPYPDLANHGIFLSGKVTMDDGTPPPQPVTIERVCSVSQRAQAYTDSKGRFSFQTSQTAGVQQDASEQGGGAPGTPRPQYSGIGSAAGTGQSSAGSLDPLGNCDLRALLPGYRSDIVSLKGRRLFDNPDVGTIVLHRLANVEGSVISVTSLEAPNDARKAYDKAREALKKNKLPEAEKDLQKAVEVYPKYAAAWYDLGRLQQRNSAIEQARQSYAHALAADAKFTSPYLQLADLAAASQNWPDLADITSRLLKLDSLDYPQQYLYNAIANFNLGKFDATEQSARAGQKLDTSHQYPKLDWVLAMALAKKKDFAGAVEQMRSYLQFAPASEDIAKRKKELADLEALAGAS